MFARRRSILLLVLAAALGGAGCIATALRLPPEDPADLGVLLEDHRPGQGGTLLWRGARGDLDEDALEALRATGVFTEVRRDDGAGGPPADWVLRLEGHHVTDRDHVPRIEFGPILTLGILPSTDHTRHSTAYRLTHARGAPVTSRTLSIPGLQGRVTGLVAPFLYAMHADWHVVGAEEALRDRVRDRLVKEILRAVLGR